jgi:cell division septal protein FtsQ
MSGARKPAGTRHTGLDRLGRLTRRTRRRLFVVGTTALIGGTLPLWVPQLLAKLPAFRVARVEVVGTRYVAPDEIARLAAVDPDASVWDDTGLWEHAVEAHPLVSDAHVRRTGLRTLEIRVTEDRPVALAATPELVPVNADGRVLPLDPTEVALDLPVLGGTWSVDHERLTEAEPRRLVALLAELEAYDAAFIAQVSEITCRLDGSVEILMLPAARTARILLPSDAPLRGLQRVELALGDAGATSISVADARFSGQVVLRMEGES